MKSENEEYMSDRWSEIRLLFWRQVTVQWRNKFGLYARLFQVPPPASAPLSVIFFRNSRKGWIGMQQKE